MSETKKSGLKLRLFSGFILAPLTILIIIIGNWLFLVSLAIAAGIALYEWQGLAKAVARPYLLFLGVLYVGVLYVIMCFSSYIFLRFSFEQGTWLALSVMLSVWASDIGGFVVGKKLKSPQLAPKISPKKTWAGLGGAMSFCGLAFVILLGTSRYFSSYMATDLGLKPGDVWGVFLMGCFLGAVGQAGDLLISYFKREAGVKDTGQLIPGHGGLLDRIDALMLVSPVFTLILLLWLGWVPG